MECFFFSKSSNNIRMKLDEQKKKKNVKIN